VLQTEAPETCFPLTGSAKVRTLDADCYTHESGVSVCAENADVSLHLSSGAQGLTLTIDLDVVSTEHWADTRCEDD
jgi:hypothetical protein